MSRLFGPSRDIRSEMPTIISEAPVPIVRNPLTISHHASQLIRTYKKVYTGSLVESPSATIDDIIGDPCSDIHVRTSGDGQKMVIVTPRIDKVVDILSRCCDQGTHVNIRVDSIIETHSKNHLYIDHAVKDLIVEGTMALCFLRERSPSDEDVFWWSLKVCDYFYSVWISPWEQLRILSADDLFAYLPRFDALHLFDKDGYGYYVSIIVEPVYMRQDHPGRMLEYRFDHRFMEIPTCEYRALGKIFLRRLPEETNPSSDHDAPLSRHHSETDQKTSSSETPCSETSSV